MENKKYRIYVKGLGWYSGRNKKYYDMFNINSKEFAKIFDNFEDVNRVVNSLVKADYPAMYIEEIDNE